MTRKVVSLRAALGQLFDEEKLHRNAESNDQEITSSRSMSGARSERLRASGFRKDNQSQCTESLNTTIRDEEEIDHIQHDNKNRYDALAAKMIQIEKVMHAE